MSIDTHTIFMWSLCLCIIPNSLKIGYCLVFFGVRRDSAANIFRLLFGFVSGYTKCESVDMNSDLFIEYWRCCGRRRQRQPYIYILNLSLFGER